MITASLASLCSVSILLCVTKAAHDPILHCGACLGVVEELQNGIDKTDQSKTLQVGSFRINPDGTQDLREVKFATSELNIMELIENVCSKMNNYGKTTSDGRTSVIRTQSEPGVAMSLKNIEISGAVGKGLQRSCEWLLEEHEEDLIKVMQKEVDTNKGQTLCVEMLDVCTTEDVEHKQHSVEEAKRLGLNEELERAKAAEEEDDDEEDEDDEEEDEDEDEDEEEGEEDEDAGDSHEAQHIEL